MALAENQALVKWITKMKVLQKMLKDRGWENIELYGTPSELYCQYTQSETQVVLLANAYSTTDKLQAHGGCTGSNPVESRRHWLRVYVCRSPSLTAPAMSDIEELRGRATDVIVLFSDKITYVIDKANLRYTLEPKLLNSLNINITKHALVPRHRKLEENEIAELSAKFGDLTKLPILLLTDPVARYYNFPLGAIISITRTEGNFYRRVHSPNGSTNFERFFLD